MAGRQNRACYLPMRGAGQPFFYFKIGFLARSYPTGKSRGSGAAVVRQNHHIPNQENDKVRPQRPPPAKLR